MTKLELIESLPPWQWPPDARQTFLKALADRTTAAPDRLIAAELAGDMVVINEDLAQLLAGIAADPAEPLELRANAAIALGPILEHTFTFEFDDPDDVYISPAVYEHLRDGLHELYADATVPKILRRRALEAAVRAPDDWMEPAISEAYDSGDHDWLLTAVFCMHYVRGFNRQILESLENPDPAIHRHAVEAASHAELAAAWPHVLKILNDKRADKDLLLTAIEAAACIRPQEAFDVLDPFTDSDDEDIADAAQEAIDSARLMEDDDLAEDDEEFDDEDDEDPPPGSPWKN